MFFKWPWTRAPAAAAQGGHHPLDEEPWSGFPLHVEDGAADAESAASSEHHRPFPVEEPLHIEEGESAAASVHGDDVAGSCSEESSCDWSESGGDDETVERSAAVRRERRGRRRGAPRRKRTDSGLPAFMAAVGSAAAVMLLALVALVAWKRRHRGSNGGEMDDARAVP